MRIMHTGRGNHRGLEADSEFAHLLSPLGREGLAKYQAKEAKRIAEEQSKKNEKRLCWCITCTHLKPFAGMCIECRQNICEACFDPETKTCANCKRELRK